MVIAEVAPVIIDVLFWVRGFRPREASKQALRRNKQGREGGWLLARGGNIFMMGWGEERQGGKARKAAKVCYIYAFFGFGFVFGLVVFSACKEMAVLFSM